MKQYDFELYKIEEYSGAVIVRKEKSFGIYVGLPLFFLVLVIASIGAYQLFKNKSLKKVDKIFAEKKFLFTFATSET